MEHRIAIDAPTWDDGHTPPLSVRFREVACNMTRIVEQMEDAHQPDPAFRLVYRQMIALTEQAHRMWRQMAQARHRRTLAWWREDTEADRRACLSAHADEAPDTCPECGTATGPGDRRCDKCGEALSVPARIAEAVGEEVTT